MLLTSCNEALNLPQLWEDPIAQSPRLPVYALRERPLPDQSNSDRHKRAADPMISRKEAIEQNASICRHNKCKSMQLLSTLCFAGCLQKKIVLIFCKTFDQGNSPGADPGS